MTTQIIIQKVTETQLAELLTFSKTTFLDAFAHQNNPEDIALYVAKAFATENFYKEFHCLGSEFYFALLDREIAGYIKLNFNDAQTEFQRADEMEVERIYVSAQNQRKQVGEQLLNFAIQTATARNLRAIWLGVWEHNLQAIRFYERHGFAKFSSHNFMLGNDRQIDILVRKELEV